MMITLQFNENSSNSLYINRNIDYLHRNIDYLLWPNLFSSIILSTFNQLISESFQCPIKVIHTPPQIKDSEAIQTSPQIEEIKEKDEIVELPEPRSTLQKITDTVKFILFSNYCDG